jgi:hypothetical protein
MTLTIIPTRLPILEPMAYAYKAACLADLPEALEVANDAMTGMGLPHLDVSQVPLERNYRMALLESYEMVQAWPTVGITVWGVDAAEMWQQPGHGTWQGQMEVRAFLQASDPQTLDGLLQRWGVALWLVALNNSPLAGAVLDLDSFSYGMSENSGTANERVVVAEWKYKFRT